MTEKKKCWPFYTGISDFSLSKLFFFWKKTENWNQKWERTKLKLHLFQSSNFLRAIPTILKFEWPDNDDDEEKKIHFGYFVFKRRTRRTAHVNESKVVNRNSGRSYADAYSVSSLFFQLMHDSRFSLHYIAQQWKFVLRFQFIVFTLMFISSPYYCCSSSFRYFEQNENDLKNGRTMKTKIAIV